VVSPREATTGEGIADKRLPRHSVIATETVTAIVTATATGIGNTP
jgi:hypothetical protein